VESSQRQYLGIGFLAVILLTIVVIGLGEVDRMDAEKHISERACGPSHPPCPGELECSNYHQPDRFGLNISGHRCVTPQYIERYCGLLQFRAAYTTAESFGSLTGRCRTLLHPLVPIKRPGLLVDAVGKLLPAPDGEDVLARYNLSSLADHPGSAHDPIEPRYSCSWAGVGLINVTYYPSNGTATVFIGNTAMRALNVTVDASRGDMILGSSDTHPLDVGETRLFTIPADQQPDQLTAIPQDCTEAIESTTSIPSTNETTR